MSRNVAEYFQTHLFILYKISNPFHRFIAHKVLISISLTIKFGWIILHWISQHKHRWIINFEPSRNKRKYSLQCLFIVKKSYPNSDNRLSKKTELNSLYIFVYLSFWYLFQIELHFKCAVVDNWQHYWVLTTNSKRNRKIFCWYCLDRISFKFWLWDFWLKKTCWSR